MYGLYNSANEPLDPTLSFFGVILAAAEPTKPAADDPAKAALPVAMPPTIPIAEPIADTVDDKLPYVDVTS